MSTKIIGIDPGTTESAVLFWDGKEIIYKEILPNTSVIIMLQDCCKVTTEFYGMKPLLIEKIECYGMPIGVTTIETIKWCGRFIQAWRGKCIEIPRRDIKLHFCGNMRAKDSNIRQVLIDRFGKPGTKKQQGMTYGLKTHLWQAFALCVYFTDKEGQDETHRKTE